MTEQQIMEKLELRPWCEFALERIRYNVSEDRVHEVGLGIAVKEVLRQTGRTTRLIVQAIYLLSEKNMIVNTSFLLRKEVRHLLVRLGLEDLSERVTSTTFPVYDNLYLLCDHED